MGELQLMSSGLPSEARAQFAAEARQTLQVTPKTKLVVERKSEVV